MAETDEYALYTPFQDTDGEVRWEMWTSYETEEAARQEVGKFMAAHSHYPVRLFRGWPEEIDNGLRLEGDLIFANGDLKEWEEISEREDFMIDGAIMIGPKED